MLEKTALIPRQDADSEFCQNVDNRSPEYMVPINQNTTMQSFIAVQTSNVMNSSICQMLSNNKTPKFIFVSLAQFLMYYNTGSISFAEKSALQF
jgi:hypothetical protein